MDVRPSHIASRSGGTPARSGVARARDTRSKGHLRRPGGRRGRANPVSCGTLLYSTRVQRNWFELHGSSELESEALTAFLNAYGDIGPVGFVVDDLGRGKVEAFDQLVSAAKAGGDIWILGSIRSEDAILVPHGKSVAFLENSPGDDVAKAIWENLRQAGQTDWAGVERTVDPIRWALIGVRSHPHSW